MSNDIDEWVKRDKQRFKNGEWGMSVSGGPLAYIELGFGALTTLVGLLWLVSLYWTPDPIDGSIWLGVGMLGMLLFGGPTMLIFWLRRGGVETLQHTIRSLAR